MKIFNISNQKITLTDIDRGIANGQGLEISETWNGKADNVIDVRSSINVFDSERVMLSASLGQIKKWKDASFLDTQYSITGTNVGDFIITVANNVFAFEFGATTYSVTLPTGTLTIAQVTSAINSVVSGASGFLADGVDLFRSSNMTPMTDLSYIEGPLGSAYGQRGPSILGKFLNLACDEIITIGTGSANSTLGFHSGDFTKAK